MAPKLQPANSRPSRSAMGFFKNGNRSFKPDAKAVINAGKPELERPSIGGAETLSSAFLLLLTAGASGLGGAPGTCDGFPQDGQRTKRPASDTSTTICCSH